MTEAVVKSLRLEAAGAYLRDVARRRSIEELRRNIVFGGVLGLALSALGGAHYFLVIGASDRLWWGVLCVGLCLSAVSFVVPQAIGPLQRAARRLTGWVGEQVFLVLLTTIYFAFIWPAGAILRSRNGIGPMMSWDDGEVPVGGEGWISKDVEASPAAKTPTIFRSVLALFAHLKRHGAWIAMPAVILLLALGVLLFFVQTSALAPFIYTLF